MVPREGGELAMDSTSEDTDTKPCSSCLNMFARRNQIESKYMYILEQHTTKKQREERAAP